MARDVNTNFGRMLAYIDTQPLGSTITRPNLLKIVYGRSVYPRSTVDKWRRQLTVLGYLKATRTPGVFIKMKEVPGIMTTSWLEEWYSKELKNAWKRREREETNQAWEY